MPNDDTRAQRATNVTAGLLLTLGLFSGALAAVIGFELIPLTTSWSETLTPGRHSEFGLMENLQNALLALLAAHFMIGARTSGATAVRILVGLFFVFLFLEETDYLTQFYDRWANRPLYTTVLVEGGSFHGNSMLRIASRVVRRGLLFGTMVLGFGSFVVKQSVKLPNIKVNPIAGLIAGVILLAFVIAVASDTLPDDDERQLRSETSELALYAAWAVLAGWRAKAEKQT